MASGAGDRARRADREDPADTDRRRLTKGYDRAPSWSPDGRTIAFAHAAERDALDSSIRAIDADGRNERVLISDGEDPDWSPDGSKIVFVQGLNAAIAILDVQANRTTRLTRGGLVAAPSWSPDGHTIAFEDLDDVPSEVAYTVGITEIYAVDATGTKPRRLTRNTAFDQTPAWTPDGRILFTSSRGGPSRVYVMNHDGSRVRRFR